MNMVLSSGPQGMLIDDVDLVLASDRFSFMTYLMRSLSRDGKFVCRHVFFVVDLPM